jgi:hypothetical protein
MFISILYLVNVIKCQIWPEIFTPVCHFNPVLNKIFIRPNVSDDRQRVDTEDLAADVRRRCGKQENALSGIGLSSKNCLVHWVSVIWNLEKLNLNVHHI